MPVELVKLAGLAALETLAGDRNPSGAGQQSGRLHEFGLGSRAARNRSIAASCRRSRAVGAAGDQLDDRTRVRQSRRSSFAARSTSLSTVSSFGVVTGPARLPAGRHRRTPGLWPPR